MARASLRPSWPRPSRRMALNKKRLSNSGTVNTAAQPSGYEQTYARLVSKPARSRAGITTLPLGSSEKSYQPTKLTGTPVQPFSPRRVTSRHYKPLHPTWQPYLAARSSSAPLGRARRGCNVAEASGRSAEGAQKALLAHRHLGAERLGKEAHPELL